MCSIDKKAVLFLLFIHPEKKYHRFQKYIKQHLTVSNIDIRLSEGSCDTEDWSSNTENSVLHYRDKLYFKIYSNRKVILNCNNISQYIYIYIYIYDAIFYNAI